MGPGYTGTPAPTSGFIRVFIEQRVWSVNHHNLLSCLSLTRPVEMALPAAVSSWDPAHSPALFWSAKTELWLIFSVLWSEIQLSRPRTRALWLGNTRVSSSVYCCHCYSLNDPVIQWHSIYLHHHHILTLTQARYPAESHYVAEWSTLIGRDCRDRVLIGRKLYRTEIFSCPKVLL